MSLAEAVVMARCNVNCYDKVRHASPGFPAEYAGNKAHWSQYLKHFTAGMTMTNFDQMTDEEIDAYLEEKEKAPVAAPGIREYGWVLLIAGIVGAFASFQLLLGEWELAENPGASLACDVNAVLACSTFLTSWEGSILGFSNSYVGIAGFGAMALFGIYVIIKKSLPREMWTALAAAAGVGLLALLWFQYTSFISSGTLCPWCLVIWAALIPFITQTAGQVHANLTDGRSVVWRFRWLIVIVWYIAIAAFAFFYFLDTWKFVYGWDW